MRDLIRDVSVILLIIATVIMIIGVKRDQDNRQKCLDSKYKTSEWAVNSGNNKLYCRSSPNSMQMLKEREQ